MKSLRRYFSKFPFFGFKTGQTTLARYFALSYPSVLATYISRTQLATYLYPTLLATYFRSTSLATITYLRPYLSQLVFLAPEESPEKGKFPSILVRLSRWSWFRDCFISVRGDPTLKTILAKEAKLDKDVQQAFEDV